MKIVIASDHAGFELKEEIKTFLKSLNHSTEDLGPFSSDSVDYADFAHPLANAVESGKFDFGIAICGSGNGINMTVNKHQGIRSALCWNKEIAALARQHNNANICSLPARFISSELAFEIVETFLKEKFEGGRHERRVNKISCK
jgi:ribose 5-phosphate isomerase B